MTEVLLLRTRAAQVLPVYRELFRRFPTARAFGAAEEEELAEIIRPLGLRWRVPLLAALAHEIGKRNGRLPRTQKELEKLPAVGPYAAASALSLHGGRRAVIIDANVVRVLARLVGREFDGETRRKRWLRDLAEYATPARDVREFNYALLDLGATVCRPRAPRCTVCPFEDLCAHAKAAAATVGTA